MINPENFQRRSFIYRRLQAAGAEIIDVAEAAVANQFLEEGDATNLGIADLSPLPRIGFKGPKALTWVEGQNIDVPSLNNMATPLPDGSLVARLADTEVLILSNIGDEGATISRLETMQTSQGCYVVPRAETYFWFLLTGVHAPDCLLKVCGVDIRPHKFPNHSIAQTSIARLGTVAIRDDRGPHFAYHLIADSTTADYFWTSLLDAMAEFDGRPIGLNSLAALS